MFNGKAPHIITPEKEVRVVRADQIVAGGVYRIVGTTLVPDEDKFGNIIDNSFSKKPIPPQVAIITDEVVYHSEQDVGHVKIYLYADSGFQGSQGFHTILGLDQVNVPEHGRHDIHLERVPDAKVQEWVALLKRMNKKSNYTEEAMDRTYWKFKDMGGKEE